MGTPILYTSPKGSSCIFDFQLACFFLLLFIFLIILHIHCGVFPFQEGEVNMQGSALHGARPTLR